MISKMILASGQLGCSEEMITIAATLSIQVNPINSLTVNKYLYNFLSPTLHWKSWNLNIKEQPKYTYMYLGCIFSTISLFYIYRRYLNF